MSKAFTKESDDDSGVGSLRSHGSDLPPSVKNYMTPEGAERLRNGVERLSQIERPAIIESGDTRALYELDRRLTFLRRRLEALEVIDPAKQPPDRVLFGATVTVRHEDGATRRYRIVGVDESDPQRGDVSWLSPIAKVLLGAQVGDIVTLQSPKGGEEIEVIEVNYSAQG